MGRLSSFSLLASTCLAILASCTTEKGPPPLSVWSEFLPDEEVRDALPFLAEEKVGLNLAIPSARIGDPGLEALLFDAQDAGIEVRAWLLLDEADGYWPNEHNVDAMRTATTAFADWRESAALPVDWLIFDMEMSLERTEAIAEAGGLTGLPLIEEGLDPETFVISRAAYVSLVEDLQARGLKVMAVTYPMVLDDHLDGDDDIQDKFDVPIAGVPWDEVSFMVYQSTIANLSGEWHGPDVIASYTESAVEVFGDRASVALGIVGSAGIVASDTERYPDAPTFLGDLAAARASGVPVSVYSLDGILEQEDPGAWLDRDIEGVEPRPVTARSLRNLIRGILD